MSGRTPYQGGGDVARHQSAADLRNTLATPHPTDICATWRETTYAGTIRQDAVASRHGHVGRARSPRAAYQQFVRADEQKSTWFEEIGWPTQPSLGPALHPAPQGGVFLMKSPRFSWRLSYQLRASGLTAVWPRPASEPPQGGVFLRRHIARHLSWDCCGVAALWLAAVTCFVIFDGPVRSQQSIESHVRAPADMTREQMGTRSASPLSCHRPLVQAKAIACPATRCG